MTQHNLRTEIIALCDYANISQEGKVNINGVFDELKVQQFPGGIARAYFVASITGSPTTSYKLTLKVEPASGFVSQQSEFPLNALTGSNGKYNFVIELAGLGFKEKGDYRFILSQGEKEIGSTTLKVFHVSDAEVNHKTARVIN